MPDDNRLSEHRELTKADALASTLLGEFRGLIETARQRAAQAVSAELVLLYWRIGARLRTEVLGGERAQYGEAIVSTLSRQLSADYGAGFSRQNLFHMVRFAEAWRDESKVLQLGRALGVEPYQGNPLFTGSPAARVLRGDLPPGEVERPHLARAR
jgi:hypothetical protein